MDRPVPDHRGPELPGLVADVTAGLKQIFQTASGEIALFPGSGTGGWEAAIVNTLNPDDRVLAFNIGQFGHQFAECAQRLGMRVDEVDLPWGTGVPAALVYERLHADRERSYAAVLVEHNETSTGVTSNVRAVREAMDAAGHPAPLLVEAIRMLAEEGLPRVFARHGRLADGVRRAIHAWGLQILCRDPQEYSNTVTAVVVPDGADADAVRKAAVQHLNLSLGAGLGRLKGRVFRIGHLGALNELEVLATLAGTEMALTMAGVRVPPGAGVTACEQFFLEEQLAPISQPAGQGRIT